MEWNISKTLNFIDDYRRNEVLWDTKHADYKNYVAKKATLHQLAERYGGNLEGIKKKIKNLRTVFHREHKKLTSKMCGSNFELPARRWFAYDAMQFILDADDSKEYYSFEGNNSELNTYLVKEEDELQYLDEEDEKEEDETSVSLPSFSSVESSKVHLHDTTIVDRKRSIPESRVEEPICKILKIIKQPTHRDEFNTYGEYVGNEIRKLQPAAQIIAKHHINNILFEAAMGKYDDCNRTYSANQTSEILQSNPDTSSDLTFKNHNSIT